MESEMRKFVHIRFDGEALADLGLPDIPYPVRIGAVEQAVGIDNLPFAELLFGLQQQSETDCEHWQTIEPAMERLAELIAPEDDRDQVEVAGDNWWLEVGPVDPAGKVVTIQRGEHLVAAIGPREDGRLRIAVFRPLDGNSAGYLVGLAITPHPEHGVCMRENNWEYALDCSAGMGNHYAAERGASYLSFWSVGVGTSEDGTEVAGWRSQQDLVARQPCLVATELGVHYTLADTVDSTASGTEA